MYDVAIIGAGPAGATLARMLGFYVNVDREAFDRWLVSLVPDRVETGFGWRLTSLERDPDATLLRFTTAQNGRASALARLVVGADGASSLVRRLAFAESPSPRRYSAIQAAFELPSADPFYGAFFDSRLTDFYGWSIPKGDRLLVGAAFSAGPGAGAGQRFEALIDGLRNSGLRLGAEIGRSGAMISRPTSLLHLCPGAGGVLLVGEAAGFISPSSAEGISYALRSASALASALESGLVGADARYRSAAWPLALNVGAKAIKASAIYGSTTRRLVMRSGLGAIPRTLERAPLPAAATAAR